MVHGLFSLGILLVSLILLYFSYRYVKYIIGEMKIPFISLFFLFKYILLVYVGSVILNIFYIPYHVNIGTYEHKDLLFNIWLYSSVGLFLIPSGMAVANGAFKYQAKEEVGFFLSKHINIKQVDLNNILLILYTITFTISLVFLFIYKAKIGGSFPIEGIINGLDSSALALLRSDASNNFQGRYWLYMLIIKHIPLMLLLLVFFLKDYALKYKLFFLILLSYNLFVSVMDVQKAPILKIIFLLLLVKIYKDGYISKKLFVFIGVLTFSMAMVMYILFMGASEKTFLEILQLPLERIFIGNIAPLYWWQLFQEHNGYLYGTSFPNPGHIFDFEWRRITVEVMEFTHPNLVKLGIVGSMPTVFFASWFINFGLIMMFFSMILFGFIIQMFDIIFIRTLNKNKHIYLLVALIITMYYFGQFAETSFEGFIFSPTFYFPLLFMYMMYVVRNSLLKKEVKQNE